MAGERKLKKLESNFVNLTEPGQSTEGTIISRDSVRFRNRDTSGFTEVGRYRLKPDDGPEVVLLGATTLDDQLDGIPDGIYVKVVFTGTEKAAGSGNQIKKYDVFTE